MKYSGINKKRLVAFMLSFLFVMQQSMAYQVLAASIITNGDGSPINPNTQTGNYEIRPDAVNGNTGFKHFNDLQLGQGDVLNFIFQWYQQNQTVDGDTVTHTYKTGDIDNFINLVNGQVKIDGIVNALTKIGSNGALKTDGNLVFISPQGMVVGASGVLNVGSLSVITPAQNDFDRLKNTLNLPQSPNYAIKEATAHNGVIDPDSIVYDKNTINVVNTDATFDSASLAGGNEAGNIINIDGAVIARGNVELKGGDVNIGKGGLLVAGVGGNTEVIKTEDAAKTLFDKLVKTDNMASGNAFASSNGNIVITSKTGTSVGADAIVRNYGNGNITITNTGSKGINIAGEVSNPNGAMKITNNAGGLLVDASGNIRSGANNNNSTLLVYNDGNGGMNIKGKVDINHANKTGSVQFTNKNSNMTIGHADNNNNISSNADVNIDVTDGNLLNNGVDNTLIATTNGADLNINVTNGAVGEEIGPNDGAYTGIGTDARDLTKSVNVSIDGKIKAISTKGTNKSLINLASLNKNMNVDQIKADGRVILLADDSANKGGTAYDILNKSTDKTKPNVEGAGISIIASGNIGGGNLPKL